MNSINYIDYDNLIERLTDILLDPDDEKEICLLIDKRTLIDVIKAIKNAKHQEYSLKKYRDVLFSLWANENIEIEINIKNKKMTNKGVLQ